MFNLKEEQKKAARQLERVLFTDNKQATLASICTGWGKTVLASKMIEKYTRFINKPLKCLFIVDRSELLKQTGQRFKQASNLQYTIEQASKSADLNSDVVLATRQSLSKPERLQRFPQDHFQFIVIDEAHGAVCEDYQKIISHFKSAKFLFLTATADSLVDKGLFSICDGGLGYEFTLRQSVAAGMNAKPRIKNLKLDISDFSEDDLRDSKIVDSLRPLIINELKKNCLKKKTILFFPDISTSKTYFDELKQNGFNAFHIDSGMTESEREATLKGFAEAGKGSIICNATLLGTGYDQPDIDCVCVLRNIQSRALYAQMVGRALRIHPGKENGLILDLFGLSAKHNITASVAELEMMKKYKLKYELIGGDEYDLLECEDLESLKKDAHVKMLKDLLEAQREKVKEEAPRKLKFVSSILPSDLKGTLKKAINEGTHITQENIFKLAKLGYSSKGINTNEGALYILKKHKYRTSNGLASIPQICLLLKNDCSRNMAEMLTREQATLKIEKLLNRWKKPNKAI